MRLRPMSSPCFTHGPGLDGGDREKILYDSGYANVAQLVEQLIRNEQVVRSIRIVGSNKNAYFVSGKIAFVTYM